MKLKAVFTLLALSMLSAPSSARDFESSLSASDIARAQAALVEVGGLRIIPDGKIAWQTRTAIDAWRENVGSKQKGPLTSAEFRTLAAVDPAKLNHKWAMIAASMDGSFSVVTGRSSGVEAMKEVMASCQNRSTLPKNCALAGNFDNDAGPWPVVAIHCSRSGDKPSRQIFITSLTTIEQTRRALAPAPFGLGFDPKIDCRELVAIDGTGKRY